MQDVSAKMALTTKRCRTLNCSWPVVTGTCMASYGFVRAGIEAQARLERVKEERSQLRLHAHRLVHWIYRRLAVLLEALDEPDSGVFEINLKRIIIHHYRVIKSLLKADAPLFGPKERALLLTMQRRIIETLDPEKITITAIAMEEDAQARRVWRDENGSDWGDDIDPAVGDDDIDSLELNEDGINHELNEEELGGFIAERLRDDMEAELVERFREEVDQELDMFEEDGDENEMVLDE
ncbi:hypothetical protein FN846DRAFT_344905 [Sphaerosporella brunnea]|uniref:Uncharacterized protein n=1 Tax=Sphaerosporella brunnea TaxID=1250544 RepID=A0A5J5EJB6_9PEZI|nr:hypothetical protein FN846DRAFT_344905 [Sphaerosporella brunnea]